MFERFTARARRVLVLAQQEALRLNHSFIGTEHVLLGLLGEGDGDGVTAGVFSDLGISLDDARHTVEGKVGRRSGEPTGAPPFTRRAKRVLEASLREALALRHQYIGPEHLLLGLVSVSDGVAVEVLIDLGIEPGRVRTSILEKLEPGDDPPSVTTDDRLRSVRHRVSRGSGHGRPRPYALNGWRRLWYGRIVRLPFIFYPVAWFDCSVPGTRGHLTWLIQPREFLSRRVEGSPGVPTVPLERLTGGAGRVMEFAQGEALLLNHGSVGTEHVLLGLLHEGEGIALTALVAFGISLEAARDEVVAIVGDSGPARTGPVPLAPRTKRALSLAQMEASRSGLKAIGTEHLLLGLVREGEGVAAQVLVRLGADLVRLRQRVLQMLSEQVGEK